MMSHIEGYYFRFVFVVGILLAVVACQDDDEIMTKEGTSISADSPYTYELQLILDRDRTRAEGVLDWKDGDCIYLGFGTDSGCVYGQAVYSALDSSWLLSLESELSSDRGVAYVFYSPNLSSSNLQNFANGCFSYLTEKICLYSGICSYNVGQGVVIVAGDMSPYTSRIRFQGASGTKITMGESYYYYIQFECSSMGTSIIQSAGLPQFRHNITVEIGEDGYSPYLYSYGSKTELTITINNTNYYRKLSEISKSSCFVVPTEDNLHGWQLFAKYGDFECAIDTKTQTATVLGYYGEEKLVNVPATILYDYKNYAITTVGRSAFRNRKITQVTLPNTVTSIRGSAFYGCDELQSVKLPQKLRSMGPSVFSNCKKLETIYCNSITAPYCLYGQSYNSTFDNVPSSVLVHVHPARVDEFRTAPGWNLFRIQSDGSEHLPQPTAVDLGLPSGTLWADRNVNALTPEDAGGFYSWGDSQRKNNYTASSYKYFNAAIGYTKYTITDGKRILEPQDDVATVVCGEAWRSPTYDEMQELRTYCTWSKQNLNGVEGFLVTGLNDQSIFLPWGGLIMGYSFIDDTSYLLGDLDFDYSLRTLVIKSDKLIPKIDYSYDGRYYGHLLRPVAVQ